jgi:type IV secretory pathway TrbF-like protein
MSSTKELLQTPVGQRPGTPPESRHYDSARKGWNDRVENAESNMRAWRWAALGTGMLLAGAVAGLVAAANQRPPRPLTVRVNTDGSAQVVGHAEEDFQPGPTELRYFLQHWLKLTREVPLDPVIVKSAWNEAYTFTTPQTANKLNAYARQSSSPMAKVGVETVAVQVRAVIPVTPTSYQARWTETTFSDQGQVKDTAQWTATFTIKVNAPTSDEVAMVNPLGLYITDFNWQRDIGAVAVE